VARARLAFPGVFRAVRLADGCGAATGGAFRVADLAESQVAFQARLGPATGKFLAGPVSPAGCQEASRVLRLAGIQRASLAEVRVEFPGARLGGVRTAQPSPWGLPTVRRAAQAYRVAQVARGPDPVPQRDRPGSASGAVPTVHRPAALPAVPASPLREPDRAAELLVLPRAGRGEEDLVRRPRARVADRVERRVRVVARTLVIPTRLQPRGLALLRSPGRRPS
jgi:hypothetical protein